MKNRTTQSSNAQANSTVHTSFKDHSTKLRINSERQYRLILAILEHPRATNELIQIVGANNVPDVVKKLRAKGWIIHTLTAPVFDRDGHKVDAGSYKLDSSQKEQAKQVLQDYASKQLFKREGVQ